MKRTMFASTLSALILAAMLLSTKAASATMVVTFDGIDTTTRGTWIGVYGSAGYILAGTKALRGVAFDSAPSNLDGSLTDYASLPSYISSYNYDSPSVGSNTWDWFGITANPGLATGTPLQKPASIVGTYSASREIYTQRQAGSTTFNTLTLNLTGVVPTEFTIHIYAHSSGNIRNWGGSYSITGVSTPTFTATQGGPDNAVNDNATLDPNNDVDTLDRGMWHTFTIKNATTGPLVLQLNYVSGTGVPLAGIMFDTITVPEPSGFALGLLGLTALARRRRRNV